MKPPPTAPTAPVAPLLTPAIRRRPGLGSLEGWLLVALLIYPWLPALDLVAAAAGAPLRLDQRLVSVFIYGLLALALHVQVGMAGLLQLGIAAFFGIGAMTTGVLTVAKYPFHFGFWGALLVAPLVAAAAGVVVGAPTLRLRGDYLAIVTLGFGEVLRTVLLNLEHITDGPRGLNPVAELWAPSALREGLAAAAARAPGRAGGDDAEVAMLMHYYVALLLLALAAVGLRALERGRFGRALAALRDDELAAACMGVDPGRIKLFAFALGAALAGAAGCLYATQLTTTADPNNYDFNNAVMALCCLILGGVGSLRGALLGAALLIGFDNVASPLLDLGLQAAFGSGEHPLATFSAWRWFVFGAMLIAIVRWRPQGLFPEPPSGAGEGR